MRSVKALLGAALVTLSTATPALADECLNRALDGTASASSVASAQYAASAVNNGIRDTGYTRSFWNDGSQGVFGDWVKVSWARAVDVRRVVIRGVVNRADYPGGYAVLGQARVQYWDGTAWVDVRGQPWQVNPVSYWMLPIGRGNGSEVRTFALPATVTTDEVRVLVEQGSEEGMSYLDELEVYEPEDRCTPRPQPNLALPVNGGAASGSSIYWGPYWETALNDGRRQSGATAGFWLDGTQWVWPDWAQIAWQQPVTLGRIVLRGVVNRPGYPDGYRTLRQVRVQWYDDATATWRDVVGRSGQDNPIVDWMMPVTTADGTEIREFDVASVQTTKIRALIEDGTTEGWSWLDEIEAYAP
jgi:hypothetical protein